MYCRSRGSTKRVKVKLPRRISPSTSYPSLLAHPSTPPLPWATCRSTSAKLWTLKRCKSFTTLRHVNFEATCTFILLSLYSRFLLASLPLPPSPSLSLSPLSCPFFHSLTHSYTTLRLLYGSSFVTWTPPLPTR